MSRFRNAIVPSTGNRQLVDASNGRIDAPSFTQRRRQRHQENQYRDIVTISCSYQHQHYESRTSSTTEKQTFIECNKTSRYYSSISQPLHTKEATVDMEEKTQNFLKRKLSVNDSDVWEVADQLIRDWSSIDITRRPSASSNVDSVEYCIRILDRLSEILPQNEIFFGSMLETDLLNRVMHRWKQQQEQQISSQRHRGNNNNRKRDNAFSPSVMTEKIEKYRWSSLVQPNSHTYNFVLYVSSLSSSYNYNRKSCETNGIQFAESLLSNLIQVMEVTPSSSSLVDDLSFSFVIKGLVQHHQPSKAEELLRKMKDLSHKHDDWHDSALLANAVVYSTVIDGYAKVGSGRKAQDLLDELMQYCLENDNIVDLRPDVKTFNAVINAWAKTPKSNSKSANNDNDISGMAVSNAQQMLTRMQEVSSKYGWENCLPDEYTYASIVSCCTTHQSPEKASKMIFELESILQDDRKTGGTSKLSIVPYNTILHSYAKAGKAKQAQAMLEKLLQRQRAKGQPGQPQEGTSPASSLSTAARPDQQSFNTVISAWSKSKDPDAPLRAEALMELMKDWSIQPTVVTYGSLINCWANSNRQDSAERAEQILKEMQQQHRQEEKEKGSAGTTPAIKPNLVCYNAVLKGWAKKAQTSRDTEPLTRLTSVFDDLLKQQQQEWDGQNNNGGDDLKPTIATFKTMLHAVVGSNAKNKLERAQVVIALMKRFGMKPDANDIKIVERLASRSGRQAENKT